MPADHDNMVLPPHSKLLAEYFDACLDTAVRENESAGLGMIMA
jgi:hypothetical protein